MNDFIEDITLDLSIKHNKLIEKLLIDSVKLTIPPIKGEITQRKLKLRKINICEQSQVIHDNKLGKIVWIEQEGQRISPHLFITFDLKIK